MDPELACAVSGGEYIDTRHAVYGRLCRFVHSALCQPQRAQQHHRVLRARFRVSIEGAIRDIRWRAEAG